FEMTKFSWPSVLLIAALFCAVASLTAFSVVFLQTGQGSLGYAIAPFILAVYAASRLLRSRAARHSAL
ncbi:MAG: hypothetical protein ABI748_05625, partial [Dokdonella sp.]